MKHETKIKDIQAIITANETAKLATREAAAAMDKVKVCITNTVDPMPAIQAARDAYSANCKAQDAVKKLPASRRDGARQTVAIAEEIGKDAAMLGGDYSGFTGCVVKWGDKATACTDTDRGEQYSRKCTYHKTDATHTVTLKPEGVISLVENEALRLASIRDGLHLIALYPDSSCVWVRNRGKAIIAENGWIAGNAQACFHSLKSADDATKGFERKLATLRREQEQKRKSQKDERRARLVARLCSITATLQDAKSLGFCSPGIQAFQSRFNIGDSATLPQLMATKDPSAIRLALHIARNAKHQTA